MSFDRMRYEVRFLGMKVFLAPVLLVFCLALFAIILQVVNTEIDRFFTATLELIIPLAAGMLVVAITTQDAAIELQLTMPRRYPQTVLGRFLLTIGWIACITLLFSSLLFALNYWYKPTQITSWSGILQLLSQQLVWLAPLLWFVVVGLCLGQLMHSFAASTSLLSGIWLLEMVIFTIPLLAFPQWARQLFFLFPTTFTPKIDFWLANRLELLVTALVLLPLGWLLLHNTEGILKASKEGE